MDVVDDVVQLGLVGVWALAALFLIRRDRRDGLGWVALTGAAVGAAAWVFDALDQEILARAAVGVLPAVALHLLSVLPDGVLGDRRRRVTVAVGYVVGALVGALASSPGGGPSPWANVALWAGALALGVPSAQRRYGRAGAVDRRRMLWLAWAVAVVIELALVVLALELLADWPPQARLVVLASTVVVPLSLVAGAHARLVTRVDRLLAHTISLAGLTGLVILAYVAVVATLGRGVRDGERAVLLLSMAAAVVAAVAYPPLRNRLSNTANQLIYGDRVNPDEALRTWGSRLTRAIPLDELLLQLVETLRSSMMLASAELYTGAAGHYELAAGVPHRAAPPLVIGEKERAVIARAGVSGGTWLDVWLPQLAGARSADTRVAPIAHAGELLGLISLTRRPGGEDFGEDDDRALTELARQVGLALHNVQLDSALQQSLADLRRANTDLQDSRLRIVSAGDAERRKLERNLHDGAQQHLVAMAVKLRLVEELIEDDPAEAEAVVGELRANLRDAIAELRALAHGIFPPLLSTGGLAEALPAAAARAALPTTVDTAGIGRFSPEIESTVYFCCLEAMQNAGKHAGADAEIEIVVHQVNGHLEFEVRDDGLGFELDARNGGGHGFVNMTDRLGTVGGELEATSSPGHGTTIRGMIPLS